MISMQNEAKQRPVQETKTAFKKTELCRQEILPVSLMLFHFLNGLSMSQSGAKDTNKSDQNCKIFKDIFVSSLFSMLS